MLALGLILLVAPERLAQWTSASWDRPESWFSEQLYLPWLRPIQVLSLLL